MQSQLAIRERRGGPAMPAPCPFALSVYPGPFLMVVATGSGDLADLFSAVDLVATAAGRNGHARALLDLMAVEIELSPLDHRTLGAHMAYVLQRFERVASVVPAQYRTGASEQAAGLKVRTFTHLNDAIDWVQDYRGQ